MAPSTSQPSSANIIPLWVNRIKLIETESTGKSARDYFKEWKVHPHLLLLLERHGITDLFPVQKQVIPWLINCDVLDRFSSSACDIVITAPTGQGRGLCALILAPTRELVKQTYDFCTWFLEDDASVYDLKGGTLLRAHLCYGSTSFVDDHTYLLEHSPQIVLFTPGRFVEHYNHRNSSCGKILDYSSIRWMVIDEVDMLLSQSYFNWTSVVTSISRECQEKQSLLDTSFPVVRPQKILVSATIPTKSAEIDLIQLNRPLLMKSRSQALYSLPANLTQWYIKTTKNNKPLVLAKLLLHIMANGSTGDKTIVFCSYRQTAHAMVRMLELFSIHTGHNLRSLELSASLSQKQRHDVVDMFRKGDSFCLVCSDVASRGMNFSNTRNVINYDFPTSIAKYIHRIGRTARAYESGNSYILLTGQQVVGFQKFTSEIQVGPEDIHQLWENHLLEGKHDDDLNKIFTSIQPLLDQCLMLEKKGKIQHDAALPSNWTSLLEQPDDP
eukprot:XP_001610503.1 DEAD/DEAH box helicase family protein [Babesia bovis T2Bo]